MKFLVRSYVFKGGIDPDRVRDALRRANAGFLVQTFDAEATSNAHFVRMIAAQTLVAEASGGLLANKSEMDFLLRLAGTSQISEAITRVGSKSGEAFLLMIAGPEGTRLKIPPGQGGKPLPNKPLTQTELGRVEKAALLSARRA